MSSEHLKRLFQVVDNANRVLILPHNNPDPDAIASAVALRYLLREKLNIEGYIVYKGIIGRAENKAMVRYLVHPLRPVSESDLHHSTPVALIDTQPGAGNNVLALASAAVIVIDHHSWPDPVRTTEVDFADVRPEVGATSTILTEYFQDVGLEPPAPLATALFYGIKTNTMGLGRNASLADAVAYYYLQPRIDVKGLAEIEHARVPSPYFKSFDVALRAARVYDGLLMSYIGPMQYPDLTAEMADLLLRLEGSHWVICAGVYEVTLVLSVRTYRPHDSARQLLQAIVGTEGTLGGHGTIAGGQIPLAGREPQGLVSQLISRALQHLKLTPGLAGQTLFE